MPRTSSLAQAGFGLGNVKIGGNIPQFRGVFQQVGIQKEEKEAPHLDFPDHGQYVAIGSGNGNNHLVAGQVSGFFDGKKIKIGGRIFLLLHAVGIQQLTEVAPPVHQTDADQR